MLKLIKIVYKKYIITKIYKLYIYMYNKRRIRKSKEKKRKNNKQIN